MKTGVLQAQTEMGNCLSDLSVYPSMMGTVRSPTYKYHPDGSIIQGKEKACLVVQGFSQRPEDYGSTYSPVAKITSIHIVLAYAAHNDLEIMSFDIKTAFLHAKLSTVIFCKQIPGYPEADPSTVL